MKMRLSKIVILGVMTSGVLTLSGCAGMNGDFNCKEVGGLGAGCVSLDQVNDMANKGAFNKNQNTTSTMDASANGSNDSNVTAPPAFDSNGRAGYWGVTPSAGQPLRYGETVQNVWIAPYVDTDGNYNFPSMVSIIIEPGHWVGSPVSAIQVSGEQ